MVPELFKNISPLQSSGALFLTGESTLRRKTLVHLTIIGACGKNVSMNQPKTEENRTPYDVESKVEGFHWWFAVRRKLLRSILTSLRLPKNCVALEAGCGTGANLRILGSAGLHGIGLDHSIYALALLKSKENFPLLAGDLNDLPIKTESLGVFIAMDILEHLHDDTRGINESYRVLKEDGLLILTVPAFRFLWGVQDRITGHQRRYTRKEIMNRLKGVGFDVLKSSYFNFFLFFPILVARWTIRFLDLKIESENKINSPLINLVLKVIFSFEVYILKYFSFPFGVSIFCIARKRRGGLKDISEGFLKSLNTNEEETCQDLY
jgi:SAM-dependent methyltransferase